MTNLRPRVPLWQHQLEGVARLLTGVPLLLADDVGLGKSAQVINAVCAAYEAGEIDALVVVAPGSARSVWADDDPTLGEFVKHVWEGLPYRITEYCAWRDRLPEPVRTRQLEVVVTNYEFIRRNVRSINPVTGRPRREREWPRLQPLIDWAAARRTWLVLDESWAVSSPKADQAKACFKLRQACARVTLLNGTPGKPEKTFTQFQILDPAILDCPYYGAFERRYCIMGGFRNKKVIGYQRMDDYERRTAPYVLRRVGGLDLPPVLPPQTIEARLSDAEWRVYTDMRDELVAELSSGDVAVARQAGVRTLRLAQILAGHVGGLEGDATGRVRDVGTAKQDAVIDYVMAQNLHKVVIWCRFRREMERLAAAFAARGRMAYLLYGGQSADEREAAKRAMAPDGDPAPAVLIGHPAAGGAGLNFAAASVAIYMTNPWSPKDRAQADGRLNRPGQTRPVRFVDVVAVGPQGQKTLDHSILKALRAGMDVEAWTAAMWRDALLSP